MVLFGGGGKKARLIGTALLVVTFVAGALAGAAAVRVVSAEGRGPEARAPGEPRSMRGGPRKLLLDEQGRLQRSLLVFVGDEQRATDSSDPLTDGQTVTFHRVEYDIETTIRKIQDNPDLDNFLGNRLRDGR